MAWRCHNHRRLGTPILGTILSGPDFKGYIYIDSHYSLHYYRNIENSVVSSWI